LVFRLLGGRFVVERLNGRALVAGLRWYQSAVPVRWLVPDFVVALMTPPPVCPELGRVGGGLDRELLHDLG
jgi:hypothetical protein